MLALTVFLKTGLIAGTLLGPGIALSRQLLRAANSSDLLLRIQTGAFWAVLISSVLSLVVLALRLGGGLDWDAISVAMASSVGVSAGLAASGALAAILNPSRAAWVAMLIIIATGIAGHGAAKSAILGALVATHVAIAAWWVGSLLILHEYCDRGEAGLSDLLERFGRIALPAILAMVAAGGVSLTWILSGAAAPFAAGYTQAFVVKIGLVAIALGAASYNRFRLTSAVRAGVEGATRRLKWTIRLELLAILGVVFATGMITTILPPPSQDHAPLVSADARQDAIRTFGDLTITNPTVSPTLGRAAINGGYLTIRNNGASPDRLLLGSSTMARAIELHQSSTEGGMTGMRALPGGLDIPPGATVTLRPGATHFMIVDPAVPIREGDAFPITLVFERAGDVEIDFYARSYSAPEHVHGN